jgi:long-subunit fatty acid transport protein
MKNTITLAGALTLAATGAMAGGIERTNQSVGILFEKADNYLEFNMGAFNPSVTGVAIAPLGGAASGDMAGNYTALSFGYKKSINDKLDFALIYDQPIGADVDYPAGTGYVVQGSTAEIKSDALTALLRYKLPSNVSLIGGVRALRTSGVADLTLLVNHPVLGPMNTAYALRSSKELDFGYVLGVAWEKPEIAARVALTYNSAITHDFTSKLETSLVAGADNMFETEVPQSVNLEFQTGVAKDTLLFGSVRWVDWTAFVLDPKGYSATYGDPLEYYTDDVITYTLGLGRKFSDNWSGAVVYGYEKHEGGTTGNLGPTDGFKSLGLAATYTRDNLKLTAGVRYVDIGNAVTRSYNSQFKDNSGWGAGLRIGYSF